MSKNLESFSSAQKGIYKKVASEIEFFAFCDYIIYVTWISYILTENESERMISLYW